MNDILTFSWESLHPLLLSLTLTGIIGLILGWHYQRFGRKDIQPTLVGLLPIIALTVCFIIWIIQGSIALSLGLVGALSIVRFRTAIKDPEDLGYLFIAIATGIGSGAGQHIPTLAGISLLLLLATIVRLHRNHNPRNSFLFHITVESRDRDKVIKKLTERENISISSVAKHDDSVQVTFSWVGSEEGIAEFMNWLDQLSCKTWSYTKPQQFPMI